MAFVVLIGASGSGKTTIARAVAARHGAEAKVFYFDSIIIPSVDEMIRECGSGIQPPWRAAGARPPTPRDREAEIGD